ncbi:MAG: hypothetical protein ABH884_01300 [Candidatus Komeilibacteria bacterium]
MQTPENKFNQQFLALVGLAEANTDEGWEKIDAGLPTICDDPSIVDWARNNTSNNVEGLRDLAGTIFEASSIELTDKDIQMLQELMNDQGYPGFRAACALAKRVKTPSILEIKSDIEQKLKKFVEDADVAEIANEYLRTLGE